MGVERWNRNQHTFSGNAANPQCEKAKVAALNGQFVDRDERLGFAGFVMKD